MVSEALDVNKITVSYFVLTNTNLSLTVSHEIVLHTHPCNSPWTWIFNSSDDEDPMVRGLALRSLCNLRLITILEYVESPLQKCLSDGSAYVRKTAVMGVLKVSFHVDQAQIVYI